jgi:hypothetical protein
MPTCPACEGTGKCHWCKAGKNNDGTVCQVCKGTGKCQDKTPAGYNCGGSGVVTKIA